MYGILVSLIIIENVGFDSWYMWFGASCMLAIITVGTAVIYLQVRTAIGYPLEAADGALYTKTNWSWEQLKKGLMIITVIPYAIFVFNSFSVESVTQRAVEWAGRKRLFAKHALMLLRVFQHVIEVLPPLLLIWKEEHPAILRPRMRQDIRGLFGNVRKIIAWLTLSIWTLLKATIILAFEPIPMFCHELEMHFSSSQGD